MKLLAVAQNAAGSVNSTGSSQWWDTSRAKQMLNRTLVLYFLFAPWSSNGCYSELCQQKCSALYKQILFHYWGSIIKLLSRVNSHYSVICKWLHSAISIPFLGTDFIGSQRIRDKTFGYGSCNVSLLIKKERSFSTNIGVYVLEIPMGNSYVTVQEVYLCAAIALCIVGALCN